jgi:hypothetical protein
MVDEHHVQTLSSEVDGAVRQKRLELLAVVSPIPTPRCYRMSELPSAAPERERLSILPPDERVHESTINPLAFHITQGLAVTVGSALGHSPPAGDLCRKAFDKLRKGGLTEGARAWSKHAHRDGSGWWGVCKGPKEQQNEEARSVFERIWEGASWRNVHSLPHGIIAYEVRVDEGYGMRWTRGPPGEGLEEPGQERHVETYDSGTDGWIFRGFVEPSMEGGHEVRWRHD